MPRPLWPEEEYACVSWFPQSLMFAAVIGVLRLGDHATILLDAASAFLDRTNAVLDRLRLELSTFLVL